MLEDITVVTGFRACGKSKLCEIIILCLNGNKKVRFIDMSDAIKYFLARPETPIGQALQQYRHIMDEGGIIPDGHLIYSMCLAYLKILDAQDGTRTQHLVLAGGFRTESEAHCFNQCGVPITIIHITGTHDNMMTGVKRRLAAGVVRTDSMSEEKLERGWHDYQTLTKPALKLGAKSRYHEISFGLSLRAKVTACIGHMAFPENVKAKMLKRVKTRDHKACIAIEAVDHPVPKQRHVGPAHAAPSMPEPRQLESYASYPVEARPTLRPGEFAYAS